MGRGEGDYAEAESPDLVDRSRGGDGDAFAELYRRYHRLALHSAARAAETVEPADVAAEAFARIWKALTSGGGPRTAFAAYLVATARNLATTAATRRGREQVLDGSEPSVDSTRAAASAAAPDFTAPLAERDLATQAMLSLPERWRWILWMVEVEGFSTAELAREAGMSHNSASALLVRARNGLRSAWVQAHVERHPGGESCTRTLDHLGAYVTRSMSPTRRRGLARRLASCEACRIEAARLEAFLGSVRPGRAPA